MSDPFIGEIIMFGGNFAPRGWGLCDGQLLPISSNTALFSLLGTTYGGDGRTTFGLPDLRGRAPVHEGTGPGLSQVRLGERAGDERVTLTTNNLPSHSHDVNSSSAEGETNDTANAFLSSTTEEVYASDSDSTMNAGVVGNSGGGQAVNIRDPYLGINYIIALTGTFPS
jgi:microcystin-dependent protein